MAYIERASTSRTLELIDDHENRITPLLCKWIVIYLKQKMWKFHRHFGGLTVSIDPAVGPIGETDERPGYEWRLQ